MSVLESAIEAANRIIHGDTNPDDVQLVAGELLGLSARLAQECALRAQAEQERDEWEAAAYEANAVSEKANEAVNEARAAVAETRASLARLREYEEALRQIEAHNVGPVDGTVLRMAEIARAVLASGGREAP